MEEVVKSSLRSMSSVKQPQAKFIAPLFWVLMVFQGKANFQNMSRYCAMYEKRFARSHRKSFDFIAFNRTLPRHELPAGSECIAAIDASFMRKSGKKYDQMQMISFMKNMAISGGMLLLVIYGAGASSVGAWRANKKSD